MDSNIVTEFGVGLVGFGPSNRAWVSGLGWVKGWVWLSLTLFEGPGFGEVSVVGLGVGKSGLELWATIQDRWLRTSELELARIAKA